MKQRDSPASRPSRRPGNLFDPAKLSDAELALIFALIIADRLEFLDSPEAVAMIREQPVEFAPPVAQILNVDDGRSTAAAMLHRPAPLSAALQLGQIAKQELLVLIVHV